MATVRAIDVTCSFDGEVVERHRVERGRRRVVWGMAAVAVALWLAAGVALWLGVRTAGRNARAFGAWLEAGRPLHEFRPARLPGWSDWVALGGLGGGLVAAVVAVAARHPSTAASLREASAQGERGVAIGVFPRIVETRGGFALEGEDGALVPVPAELALCVRRGGATLSVAAVADDAPRLPRGRGVPIDLAAYAAAVAVCVLAGGALVASVPPDPDTLGGGDLVTVRLARIVMEPPAAPAAEAGARPELEGALPAPVPMALPPDARPEAPRPRVQPRAAAPRARTRAQVVGDARVAGVLGALRRAGGKQMFAEVAAAGVFSTGLDDEDLYGCEECTDGDVLGAWGYGLRGVGPGQGGGGAGWGTIGLGRTGRLIDPEGIGFGRSGTGFG
jgi:hypothetical protein